MRAPEFWTRRGLASTLLAPAGALYAAAGVGRRWLVRPLTAPVPVISVGNLVAGGAGKTPVALALAERVAALGGEVHFLSRGYGGTKAGPLRVDPEVHSVRDVGDEALLLARAAPTWIATDRPAGAAAAVAGGARIIVMDDGHQNPSLTKDLSLVVIDTAYGYGNRRIIPAGPLREPVSWGLARAQAVVMVGEDEGPGFPAPRDGFAVLRATLEPVPDTADLAGRRVYAFAGIGRPAKFFRTLERMGADVVARRSFGDHHMYRPAEAAALIAEARSMDAVPVTTAKDAVRLPHDVREGVTVVEVAIRWREPADVDTLLAPLVAAADDG